MDHACELLVARTEGRSDGVLLTGTTGAFEELIEYVASESNAKTNRNANGHSTKSARCSNQFWLASSDVHDSGTKKFLDRVGRPVAEPPAGTSVLGDRYANILFWRPQGALFVNATTFCRC